MTTNKDRAIAHGITREKIIKTFNKNTIVQNDGCIVWTKMLNENGYGLMGIAFKDEAGITYRNPIFVHRFAWALVHGIDALPNGSGPERKGDRIVLNHTCHNRKCVNTDHMEAILQSENTSLGKKRPRNG